jgi:hypothetical protein
MFIVTDQPDLVPDRKYMTSTGVPIENGADGMVERQPTDKEMRIVSTHQAKELFGPGASIIDGVTVSSARANSHTCVLILCIVAS